MNSKEPKPGEHWIGVTRGVRGWFACEYWMNNQEPDMGPFPEPWQSDDFSFETEAEAIEHAKRLAHDNGLQFIA